MPVVVKDLVLQAQGVVDVVLDAAVTAGRDLPVWSWSAATVLNWHPEDPPPMFYSVALPFLTLVFVGLLFQQQHDP